MACYATLNLLAGNYTTRKAACGSNDKTTKETKPRKQPLLLHIFSEVACHLSSWQTKKTCLSHHPASQLSHLFSALRRQKDKMPEKMLLLETKLLSIYYCSSHKTECRNINKTAFYI